MLGAEEVPAKFNASRNDFYNALETNSLSFTIADFDNETWQIGTLNKEKSWKPATKLWFKFEAMSQEEKRTRGKGGKGGKGGDVEKNFNLDDLTLGNYGKWWGLAKASSLHKPEGLCGTIDVSHHTLP